MTDSPTLKALLSVLATLTLILTVTAIGEAVSGSPPTTVSPSADGFDSQVDGQIYRASHNQADMPAASSEEIPQ